MVIAQLPPIDAWRDFFIILLALESLVVGILLMLVLWQVWKLIQLLREEVIPLLDTTKDSVEQVTNTSVFVGRSAAAPFVKARSVVTGIREALRSARGEPRV